MSPQLALCFLQHTTRQRICVQGSAEIIPDPFSSEHLFLRLHVHLAFFHCPKYIRTRLPGLHVPGASVWSFSNAWEQDRLTAGVEAFLARQVLCYLCTIDRQGQCAVNHRGGAAGFLVTLVPDRLTPGGVILLPDYAGNGAFEAIGNILETQQAAFLVPGYADQLALCISGETTVLEPAQLPFFLRQRCNGAQRIVAMTVQHVEHQIGDWSAALAYERARIKLFEDAKQIAYSCQA
jgi:predicted pyridoxine 5'-phosphate oxidase superfamily flavin-nucleotide-binding protein